MHGPMNIKLRFQVFLNIVIVKALWFFETLGTSHPKSLRRNPQYLNAPQQYRCENLTSHLVYYEEQIKKKLRGLSPRANYTDRAAAAGRRS